MWKRGEEGARHVGGTTRREEREEKEVDEQRKRDDETNMHTKKSRNGEIGGSDADSEM